MNMTQNSPTFSTWTTERYTPEYFRGILQKYSDYQTIRNNKKVVYFNLPCAFDIETTSALQDDAKIAFMYEWTFGIGNDIVYGRYWQEFFELLEILTEEMDLTINHRLIIYVHSLSFEFQFLRKWLKWEKVFALSDRRPVYALLPSGIEFRCSSILSGYTLEQVGERLTKYKVSKLVGDLDYKLIRHSATPLTDKELGYCFNDIKVVICYIQECIENDGDITRIPLTKTGYVRTYTRNACLKGDKKNRDKYLNYMKLINRLTLTPEEYQQLKRVFQGGYTHANMWYSGKLISERVDSFDFTSSYPAVACSEKFPMSKAEKICITSSKQFKDNLKKYCCMFDVIIEGLEASVLFEHPLSASHCRHIAGGKEDNGRLISADYLETTLTEQDYFILKKFYKWEHFKVGNFRRYRKGYLPKDFIQSILTLYADKTKLKDVPGKEVDYLKSKEWVNAEYGMCVTDICRDTLEYSDGDEWNIIPVDIEKCLNDYNTKKNRFLFYPWGIWITAYARRNLFSGIYECANDYLYSDTDSVKIKNAYKHMKYFEAYNRMIIEKLEKCLDHYGLDKELIRPKTIEGIEKPLGVWDHDDTYTRFKTLGAKRYMYEHKNKKGENEIKITVAGLGKKAGIQYLLDTYGTDGIFDTFTNNLYIPPEYIKEELNPVTGQKNKVVTSATGKNTHTYLDYEQSGEITDYLGNKGYYHELSSLHLSGADYSLKLSHKYADLLCQIQEEY